MRDYEPLDLASYCNAPARPLGAEPERALGEQVFYGLPFRVGASDGPAERRCIVLNPGDGPIEIPVQSAARHVIVAHRLLSPSAPEGHDIGRDVAEYTFDLGGEAIRVPIRERFEVNGAGGWPYLARPDQKDYMQDRFIGPWELAGWRMTEVEMGVPKHFVLWCWTNPHPDRELTSIRIASQERLLIGGITLGHADEEPFSREPAREVLITLLDPDDADRTCSGGDDRLRSEREGCLEVEVDRGVAGYPFSLPDQSGDDFLNDTHQGWGQKRNAKISPAYVEVSATPSATLSVGVSGREVGSVRWGDVTEQGSVQPNDRCRIEVVQRGRNWVHTSVVDDETGKPVPCRVHYRSPEGIPYAPHGHHAHINTHLESYHLDLGGDLRLGQITYAYIDGKCQGWLPRGEVIVDVARGFEYEPLRARVEIKPGQRELELRLRRWCDMNAEGWYSGDTHVHFLSTMGGHLEAGGEDLNVVNLLASQWGHLFTNTEDITGRPSVSPDGKTVVYASQENRQHLLGHLSLLGLREPVMPWGSDGPSEAEMGGSLETTMSDWADRTHSQGGTVVIPHFPSPNGEPATLIATGRADAVEMTNYHASSHAEYYGYLNCGYRLPLVGGTDKMASECPVGLYRTYVSIPPDQPFTYDTWCANLRAGRTFLSSGPILRFTVDGHEIGDTLNLPGNGGEVEFVAEAESTLPIHRLEIVQGGQPVDAVEEPNGTRKLTLRTRVKITGHTWLAARVSGPGYQPIAHHDSAKWGPGRGIMAHTSPVYVACGGEWWMFDQKVAQYMLTLMDGSLSYIRGMTKQHAPGSATHHHGERDHMEYLERPFHEGVAAVHRRMHQLGLAH